MIYLFPARRRLMGTAGIIVPLDDTSIPSGWERFTSADSKHIVGAGSTYAAGATGGAQASISQTTSSAGDHDGAASPVNFVLNAGASSLPGGHYSITAGGGATDGAHIHTLTCKYDMAYQQIVLIKATDNFVKFPAKAMVFGTGATTPVTGNTIVYDDDVALVSGAAITTGGGSYSSTSCSNGGSDATDHVHESKNSFYNPTGASTAYSLYEATTGSTHTFTPSLSSQTLKRTYLTAWKNTSAFHGASGIIAMWESATAPYGWAVCDGTNGTIDMRDYFLMFGSAGTAGDQHDEANEVITSFSIDNEDWTHNHIGNEYTNIDGAGFVAGKHGNINVTHGHTAANDTQSYTPPYYALTFIMKL